MKKIVVLFDAPGLSSKEYDLIWDDLRAAGQSQPKGLISHVGFANPNGNWNVVDVWESGDAFAEFGKTLIPIFQKRGLSIPEPMVVPAHYVVYKNQREEVPA